jgi:hypothetical protein
VIEIGKGEGNLLKSMKNKVLGVFHQKEGRGLRNKTNELISSMNSNLPHIPCLTEHHMKQLELEHFHIENNNLVLDIVKNTKERGSEYFCT